MDTLPLTPTVRLGPREIGRLAYGCWRFAGTSVEAGRTKLAAAVDAGVGLVDTADVYGYGETAFGEAEERLGDILASDPALKSRLMVATKGGVSIPVPYNAGRDALIQACEASLTRLKVETVGLYYVHRPDLLAGHEEVASAFDHLVKSGKIQMVGVSNYAPAQVSALRAFLNAPLVAVQPEISALHTHALFDGTLDQAQEINAVPFAWSPLGGGALATGKAAGDPAQLDRVLEVIDDIRHRQGEDVTRDQVALAWLLAHPSRIVPIIGSQNPNRIRAAARAFDVKLSRRDWYAVLEASLGAPMP